MSFAQAVGVVASYPVFRTPRFDLAVETLVRFREEAMQSARARWAFRVLDAFCQHRTSNTERGDTLWSHQTTAACDASGCGVLIKKNGTIVYSFDGENEDVARIAAARCVFPTLDRNAPNWPGECP